MSNGYQPVISEMTNVALPPSSPSLKAATQQPVAWRYRYVKQGNLWTGDWKYVPAKEDCNDRPNYEIQALYTAPVTLEGLIKAVRFYEQVKRENPPVETGAWKDAIDWVLKEAYNAVNKTTQDLSSYEN